MNAVSQPQLPVVLSDISEPQPDIVLLIEVSDSTLAFDRQRKMHLRHRRLRPPSPLPRIMKRTPLRCNRAFRRLGEAMRRWHSAQ